MNKTTKSNTNSSRRKQESGLIGLTGTASCPKRKSQKKNEKESTLSTKFKVKNEWSILTLKKEGDKGILDTNTLGIKRTEKESLGNIQISPFVKCIYYKATISTDEKADKVLLDYAKRNMKDEDKLSWAVTDILIKATEHFK